jgi:flagellar basal-body rod modification protein FlgD
MASALSSLLGSSSNTSATSGSTGTAGVSSNTATNTPAPSEEVFLQLLVSQIQNQDPLNPTDSTQFVSQLAQFSELEQVIAIRSDIETAEAKGSTASSTTPAGSATTTPDPNGTGTDPSTSTNTTNTSAASNS